MRPCGSYCGGCRAAWKPSKLLSRRLTSPPPAIACLRNLADMPDAMAANETTPSHGAPAPLLRLEEITRNFGAIEALRGISFEIRRGRGGGAAGRQRRGQVDPRQDHLGRARGDVGPDRLRGRRAALRLAGGGQGGGDRDRLPGPVLVHQCRRRRELLHGARDREALPRRAGAAGAGDARRGRQGDGGRRHADPLAAHQCRAPVRRPAPGDRAQPLRLLGRQARAARRAVRGARGGADAARSRR